ncbi:glycine receptor subunit alphaZ1-like [Argiope bruennichi]|uniref:Glycine receptor subunit alphaZ1 like protein n=1 Tax=Argiope bruennichi TaxID=94029 RepID=A0A8T0FAY2_ARGBR|nr:glycine receptor subunit alphaZ1-like [Argiope bruennichi]KAF8787428.1 Glycine receptor subunit alphaZ1 like protein [Argiope bruennichi]
MDQDCLDLLPTEYKKYVPPKFKGKPINVTYSMVIYDLDEINEATMDFRLHGYLRTDWLDERLIINTSIINNRCADYLWVPDVIFEQAKVTQTFGRQNTLLTIEESKRLRSAERYAFKVSCMMHFEDYPFDTQRCSFSIVLMSTSDKAVKLRWDDGTAYPSVMFVRKMEPLQFQLGELKTYEITNGYNGANFTYLYLNITLIRRLTGSIVNIFAPSTLIVVVSWVTFWLSLEAVPARVALSITSLLTLCTQAQQNKSQLPPLNYITAVDIWLFACIFMVFSTLVEFAVAYNVIMKKKSKTSVQPSCMQCGRKIQWIIKKHMACSTPEVKPQAVSSQKNIIFSWISKLDEVGLDNICRKMFPLLFLLFATVYWVHYLKIYHQSLH